ncbi:MAG: glycosyltransferase family 2 protein [Magnetococcales bacterium]|nr:glycosyltransferase family 2 protein [Magnetococcales bacterium]
MKDSLPLVSVGIPTYNGGRWIPSALDSLLGQDYANLEIIISDNASTDDAYAVITDYQKRDSRIHTVQNNYNYGQPENFNQVFRLSRGEFFMWGSDHDLWEPSFIRKLVDLHLDNPNLALAYPQTVFMDYENNVTSEPSPLLKTVGSPPEQRFFDVFTQLGPGCEMIWGLYRSEILRKTGLFSTRLATDRILLAEVNLYGETDQIPEILHKLRQNREIEFQGLEAELRRMKPEFGFVDPTEGWSNILPYTYMIQSHLDVIRYTPVLAPDKKTTVSNALVNYAAQRFPFLDVELRNLLDNAKEAVLDKIRIPGLIPFQDALELRRDLALLMVLFPNQPELTRFEQEVTKIIQQTANK